MSENYFQKIPIIEYNGKQVVDITRSVKIAESFYRQPISFYPYAMDEGDRADNLAYFVYNDPSVAWIHYLMNGITDPYYDWYLTQDQFNALIVEKYGSFENAVSKTAFYRSNWTNDDRQIPVSFFENVIGEDFKKYWSPIFGNGSNVIGYERKKEDITMNTNKVTSLTVTFSQGNSVVNTEIVDVYDANPTKIGQAEVVYQANTDTIIVQHSSGFYSTANSTVIGRESNSIFTIVSSDLLVENITEEEGVYWETVSIFDVENEKNERNKNLRLLDPAYVLPLAEGIRQKFKD